MVGRKPQGQVFELFFYLPGKGCLASLAGGDGKHCERAGSGLGTALSPPHAPHSQPESHIWDSLNVYMLGQKA